MVREVRALMFSASFLALALTGGFSVADPLGVQSQAGVTLRRAQSVRVAFQVVGYWIEDFSGNGLQELLLVGREGQVRAWRHGSGSEPLGPEALGSWSLPDPNHTLIDSARLGQLPGVQVVVASPKGLSVHAWAEDGSLDAKGVRLARRARFEFRGQGPSNARFVQDVNADGRPDVVLPKSDSCELWMNTGPTEVDAGAEASPWPAFRRAASITVEVNRWGNHSGEDLSDVLESSFAIPSVLTRDVNGDGRPDLLVADGKRRSFHLQREDGNFPAEADVAADLTIFRDTIEKARLRPGRTLAIGDEASYESKDLDGDGIPDYVIAHRRKVWVFHGSSEGPQFQKPTTILKAADDITALTLMDLNDDDLSDLLLIKVQVPTIATLVRGIFGDWDIDISAAGYLNLGAREFETRPSFRGEVVARLPSILRLLQKPGDFLERFEEAEGRFRDAIYGDFDGNGGRDIALLSEDAARVEIWMGAPGGDREHRLDSNKIVRELLFEDEDRVWDVERLIQGLGSLAERRAAAMTGGRAPDGSTDLRAVADAMVHSARSGDFDGDGRDELMLLYDLRKGGTVLDFLRVE